MTNLRAYLLFLSLFLLSGCAVGTTVRDESVFDSDSGTSASTDSSTDNSTDSDSSTDSSSEIIDTMTDDTGSDTTMDSADSDTGEDTVDDGSCNISNSADLGNGGTSVAVNSDGCALIDFAKNAPHLEGASVTIALDGECTECPLSIDYKFECGESGTATIDGQWSPTTAIPGVTLDCPLIMDFKGIGQSINLKFW